MELLRRIGELREIKRWPQNDPEIEKAPTSKDFGHYLYPGPVLRLNSGNPELETPDALHRRVRARKEAILICLSELDQKLNDEIR